MPDATRRAWAGRFAQQRTAETLAWWGTDCHLCDDTSTPATTADHVIPRSKGGSDELANLRPAHLQCNQLRSDSWLSDWFAAHPLASKPALPPTREW